MKTRKLGTQRLEVSALGLGCMGLQAKPSKNKIIMKKLIVIAMKVSITASSFA